MAYSFKRTQHLNSDIETVWKFVSSPSNLSVITPEYMGFEIIGDKSALEVMYAGQIIQYNVSPVAGIKMRWITEITHVSDKEYFVDEQRQGPYRMWHHEHFLRDSGIGVEMTDIVTYIPPFGFIGRMANKLIIEPKLKSIFEFRFNKLEEIFNGKG